MAKIKTETAKVSVMLLDDLVSANVMTEAEAYRMLKKHIFSIKSPLIQNDVISPPFYRLKIPK